MSDTHAAIVHTAMLPNQLDLAALYVNMSTASSVLQIVNIELFFSSRGNRVSKEQISDLM